MAKEAKQAVWVLTYEVNDYDQHGEYFLAVYAKKPTIEQIIDATKKSAPHNDVHALLKFCLHVQAGGGRRGTEHTWFHLREVEI